MSKSQNNEPLSVTSKKQGLGEIITTKTTPDTSFITEKIDNLEKRVEIVEGIVRKLAAWFFNFPTDIYKTDEKWTNKQSILIFV
uniref:Uncharacterized protein n=1 Tax=Romanomermis culicivorax TaxID=13658 RepID=A0A915HPI3_ROMCU